MNTIKQIQNTVKFTGFLFLFNLLVPTLGYVFIQSRLFAPDNPILTSTQIIANEKVFRMGLLSEFFLSITLILLGYSLYTILKKVNIFLSKTALFLKITEAILMAVITLITFLALQVLIGNYQTLIDSKAYAGIILLQHGSLNSIPMIFLGIEMVIFNALFFKSRMIPRWIAMMGILAFIMIFAFATLSIISPQFNLILLTLPSFIYELIIGIWLIIKGLKIHNP